MMPELDYADDEGRSAMLSPHSLKQKLAKPNVASSKQSTSNTFLFVLWVLFIIIIMIWWIVFKPNLVLEHSSMATSIRDNNVTFNLININP